MSNGKFDRSFENNGRKRNMKKGRVTIPTDENFVEGTKKIAELWGADAVRDCDGTRLPDNAADLAEKVYNTYFIVRGDNEWGRAHPEEAHRTFLLSERVTAFGNEVTVDPMADYFAEQICPDVEQVKRWQVYDRTVGTIHTDWVLNDDNTVTIRNATPYHEYTVTFMARLIWHPVQIYNYLTNNWTCEKQLMYDPSYPCTKGYITKFMQDWCDAHPETNVVRFTTFLYQFTLIFNKQGKEKYVDWFGYTLAASPVLLDEFSAEYGYELTAEDIVDGGCYNNPFRVPTKKFLDYMDFVCRKVTETVRKLTDIVHANGKQAMMFLGDDWIGAEPYGKYFADMNLDAVVGSIGGGVTERMLAEIPSVKYREGRFLPYFFPDTFFDGNEDGAVAELDKNWITARRAMLRCPLDRMGFGGYLSLAAKFPKFVSRVAELCDEFRTICDAAGKQKPFAAITVAVLNCWGSLRSWQSHMVAHELWYQQIYSYQGVLESLSGQAVNVKFISFDDVVNGIDESIDVIVNVGAENTAYSGGKEWNNPVVAETIRKWVADGHGFVGIGEPTAYQKDGRCFVLADVLGVDKEKGFTLSVDKYNIEIKPSFITQDVKGEIDYGEDTKNIYALDGTSVADITLSDRFLRKVNIGEVKIASNDYGKGRGVYIAGLPYSAQNARLLYRALYFAAHKEKDMYRAFSSNPLTECTYYPESGKYAVVNNSDSEQTTVFYDVDGVSRQLVVPSASILWL